MPIYRLLVPAAKANGLGAVFHEIAGNGPVFHGGTVLKQLQSNPILEGVVDIIIAGCDAAAVAAKGSVVVPDLIVGAVGQEVSDHADQRNISPSCICGSSPASL